MSDPATDVHFDEAVDGLWKGLRRCGKGVRIRAARFELGDGVELEDGVTLAGDHIRIGDGARVRAGCDLRAAELDIGARCDIGEGGRIWVAESFRLGRAGRIEDGARITCRRFAAGALFYVGDHFVVGAGGTLESTSAVTLGDRIALGSYCVLNANLPIRLDDQVGSGDHVTLWTTGYHFGHSLLEGYAPAYAPIHVERNVWLAYHVTLLPGVVVGHDTIVATGSVVTRSLPASCLAAGAPAQVRRQLERRELGAEELRPAVERLLDQWLQELTWKGWTVGARARAGGGSSAGVGAPDGRTGEVHLLGSGAPLPPPPAAPALQILVSVEERADFAEGGHPGVALLELRARRHRGESFDLAEDLRDFLRRRTIPCGDDRLFQSIVPAAFQRLRSML